MLLSRTICLSLGAILILAATGATAAERYRPDVILIKLKPETARRVGRTHGATATGVGTLDLLHVQLGATRFERTVPAAIAAPNGLDRHGLSSYYTVHLPPGSDIEVALAAYAADPSVESAEPDYIMPMDVVPNDPEYDQQWTHNSFNDRDIDTEEAWDLEVGDSTVKVGIIDSGVLFTHADLKRSIWVNPGEDLDGDGLVWDADDMNGIDDDGNGKIDDLIGWDFMPSQGGCWAGEDCNGPDNDPSDFAGHGTHVGGIVAATTGNGQGVSGVAGGMRDQGRPGVKLMALRAGYLASSGQGFVVMSACAQAFDYAVANGVSVINCSWGSSGSLIRNAMLNAVANGVVITKSAGNDGGTPSAETPDIGDTTFGVLAVASVDQAGGKSGFSSYGTWVDISAPGGLIYNTYGSLGSPTYATLSGTSMSAPTVAGVAALLKSHHPWFTKTEIDTLLINYADNIDPFIPSYLGKMGSGRVNAMNALQILTTADFSADANFSEAPLTVNFTNTSPNAPDAPYEYDFGDGNTAPTADATHEYTDPGVFTVSFTGSGPSGPHTRTRPALVVVVQDTIEYGSLELENGGSGDIPVRVKNTHPMNAIYLPFKLVGPATIGIIGFTPTALISDWSVDILWDNTFNGEAAWKLSPGTTGDPLPVGGGLVGHLNVIVLSGMAGDTIPVDTATMGPGISLEMGSSWVQFAPRFVGGELTIPIPPCACDCHGDPSCDTEINVFDVVEVVAVAFRSGVPVPDPNAQCPQERTDVDCDGEITVFDVVRFVNVAFRNEDPVDNFCDPCAL